MGTTQEPASHRPRPLPEGSWATSQRWSDLLFAHWPMRAAAIESLLPNGLEADLSHGSAWLGVVPFQIERLEVRGLPLLPGMRNFPEIKLRTYVRESQTGTPGIYCFSLDVGSLLAVTLGRGLYHLPCHWAQMRVEPRGEREFSFYSRRLMARKPVRFIARYRGLGPSHKLIQPRPGTLEHFLSERPYMFIRDALGRVLRAEVHTIPAQLEEAEAEIEQNDLATACGLTLPDTPPLLHYARRMAVYIWQSKPVPGKVVAAGPAVAAAQ